MKRLTVITPEALLTAANHVHIMLGKAADPETYAGANWQDAQGNRYAVSSGLWSEKQLAEVNDPAAVAKMVAENRVPAKMDLARVAQAQAEVARWSAKVEGEKPVARDRPAGKIFTMVGDDPHALLAALGIERIPGRPKHNRRAAARREEIPAAGFSRIRQGESYV